MVELYQELPHEFDMMAQAFLHEYCQDVCHVDFQEAPPQTLVRGHTSYALASLRHTLLSCHQP